jgi:hypothetical protein
MAEQEVATETSSDSVREAIVASMKEIEEREAPETESQPPERARDETGKFARAEPEQVVPEPENPEAQPTPPPAASMPQAPAPIAAAPSSWSNAAKAKWAALDPELRAEIAKREADVHKGFTKMDEERSFAKNMQKAFAPYEAVIRASGVTPEQISAATLNYWYRLRTGDENTRLQTIAQIARENGVDLGRLTNSQPQQIDPTIAALQQELAQLRNHQQQQIQAQQMAEQQQVQSAIEAFGQDPKHRYFNDVQIEMGALMQAGRAKDMEEAYEMAIWARPDLRAQLLADQQAQLKAAAAEKAKQARAKAVSVRGGPGGTPQTTNPNSSVREDLEAAFREASGRI